MLLLRRLLRDKKGFIHNVAVLSGGSFLAQLLPVLFSPLLTRIYTTIDFGVYALFCAAINIASQLACMKYDMAIAIVKEDEEAANLFYICLLIGAGISSLMIIMIPFSGKITSVLGASDESWIFLIPFATFITGIYTALVNYNIRREGYKVITKAAIIKSVVMVLIQVLLFPFNLGGFALCVGQLIAYLAGAAILFMSIMKELRRYSPSMERLVGTARHNIRYPGYTAGGSLAGSMVYNLTSYLISFFYSASQLGYYSLINRILGTPLTVLAGSVGHVYMKRAAVSKSGREQERGFILVSVALAAMAVPPFLILFFLADPLVAMLFGAHWAPAAQMLRALAPLYLVRFVVTPVITVAIILGKQANTLLWQLGMLMLSLLPALLYANMHVDVISYLWMMSLALSIGYIVFYLYCLRSVRTVREDETVAE